MTPELKAKDLVDKFLNGIWVNGNPNHVKDHAKQCAIICCDEIIDAFKRSNPNYEHTSYWHPIDYFEKVKTEIQNL